MPHKEKRKTGSFAVWQTMGICIPLSTCTPSILPLMALGRDETGEPRIVSQAETGEQTPEEKKKEEKK